MYISETLTNLLEVASHCRVLDTCRYMYSMQTIVIAGE